MTTKKKTNSNSKTKKKGFFARLRRFIFKASLWFFGGSIFIVILYKFMPIYFTPLMVARAIEYRNSEPSVESQHEWVDIKDISMNLQKAVIATEDGLFLEHNGFDFKAMSKAFENNSKGKRIKGGSTISQQTAKNVFLWQGRSYIRKAFEAYFTFLIELFWSKERIMEVYLNSIEMGKGVYGAEAAAKFWFHKSAGNLTKYEAASLAVILPNPRKYKAVNSTNYIERRKNKALRIMRYVGKIKYE